MNSKYITLFLTLSVSIAIPSIANAAKPGQEVLKRGKYIAQISGCNDCHTPGYPQQGGNVAVEDWLTGSPVGFSGPWGVTYPKNLRNMMAGISENEWVKKAKTLESKPPMPWFILRDMQEDDLRALYQFVRSLGKKGPESPEYLPPGVAVKTPYIEFFPKNLPTQASTR